MSLTFNERRALKRIKRVASVDWAEQDRKQLLLHTRVSPLLQEAMDNYERERQLKAEASLAVSFAAAALVVSVMSAIWACLTFGWPAWLSAIFGFLT